MEEKAKRTKYIFEGKRVTLKQLAIKFGVSKRTIEGRIARGIPLEQAVSKQRIGSNQTVAGKSVATMDCYAGDHSLCWHCDNATNGNKCPWARNFTPVKGWKAEKNRGSYNVKKCPLYRADREG